MIKLLKNLTTYKWAVFAVLILVFAQSMSDLYLPTLMADIIDKGVVTGDTAYIWKIGAVMLGITGLGALAAIAASYYSSKAAMGLGRDIRRKVFNHVERFTLQEFDQVGTASLDHSDDKRYHASPASRHHDVADGRQRADHVCRGVNHGRLERRQTVTRHRRRDAGFGRVDSVDPLERGSAVWTSPKTARPLESRLTGKSDRDSCHPGL